jgi:hypothetical protein
VVLLPPPPPSAAVEHALQFAHARSLVMVGLTVSYAVALSHRRRGAHWRSDVGVAVVSWNSAAGKLQAGDNGAHCRSPVALGGTASNALLGSHGGEKSWQTRSDVVVGSCATKKNCPRNRQGDAAVQTRSSRAVGACASYSTVKLQFRTGEQARSADADGGSDSKVAPTLQLDAY